MEVYHTSRARRALRRGNSWPVVVDTAAGLFVVKLRGAAHGTASLVAEVVVATLADVAGLQVPARALIVFDETLLSDDHNDELADLLQASRGLNLGFQFLPEARDLQPSDLSLVDEETASRIVWLDWLVMNPDRTPQNPNLLVSHGGIWLIDHGSSLGFHHNWPALTEQAPARVLPRGTHAVATRATRLASVDRILTPLMTRQALRAALAEVPDDFLRSMPSQDDGASALARRREAYVAFLWKRLKSPRPFEAAI